MTTKRLTLSGIKSLTSSFKVCSSPSINHSFDSIKTLTLSKNFTTTTQVPPGFTVDPCNNGHFHVDNNSSGFGNHPSMFNGGQNGVEFHHTQRVNPPSNEIQYKTVGTNGNFGGYYRQSYVMAPQQCRNVGCYGGIDPRYQVVNGNYNLNVGQFHQIPNGGYTGNVGMNQQTISSNQISNGGFTYNNVGQYGNFGGSHVGPPQHIPNGWYGQFDAGYQASVNRNYNPNVGHLHQIAGESYAGNCGMNQMNRNSYPIPNDGFSCNNVGQNGNFGGYGRQSYVTSPQQSPNGLSNGSYGQSDAGYQGIVNGCYNPNVGQSNHIVGDSYVGNVGANQLNRSFYQNPNGGIQNGNIGGHDRQMYDVPPQHIPNGSYVGSYGRGDVGYLVVNGNCIPNAGQFHQTVGDNYMGNVGQQNRCSYPISNGNCIPNAGQFHHTVGNSYVGNVCQQNRSSYPIPNSGFTYNSVGQNGNIGSYDRQSYAVLPRQSPNAVLPQQSPNAVLPRQSPNVVLPQQSPNGIHGIVKGNYNPQQSPNAVLPQQSPNGVQGIVKGNYNPNVGQLHQTVGNSFTGNVGMNQQNKSPYQNLNGGFISNSAGQFQQQQNRNDQQGENIGVQTQNSYSRNNAQNIQQNQFGNVGNYSTPTSIQPIQQNPNDYLGNNRGNQQNNIYRQGSIDSSSLKSKVDKCFRNIQPRANDHNRAIETIQHLANDDKSLVGSILHLTNHDNVGSNIKIASEVSDKFNQNALMESQVLRAEIVEASCPKEYKGTVEEFDGFCKEGKVKDAIKVLNLLKKQQIDIGLPQYLCLVKACGEAKALEEAKAIHKIMTDSISPLAMSTCNELLEMYSKCGSMFDAYRIFHSMPEHDLTSWKKLFSGLAENDLPEDVVTMFKQLKNSHIKPDGEIFIRLFSACGLVGKSDEGMKYFEKMASDYGIAPTMEHYASIVDMLGNSGNISQALEFIEKMPVEPSDDVYETLMKQFTAPPPNSYNKGSISQILDMGPPLLPPPTMTEACA